MELNGSLIAIVLLSVTLAVVVLYFGYKLRQAKRSQPAPEKLRYNKARELCRTLLHDRYHGQRGFIKPYVQEFGFARSSETLRKVLQETNPIPNRHYLQTILDDLAPGRYEVQPPFPQEGQQVA